jgi:hypothetical protein
MSPQPNGRPSSGDMTGRVKQQAAKDVLAEQQERAGEISMANAVESEEQRNGVFDGRTGQRIDEFTEVLVEELPTERAGFFPEEPVLSGKEAPEELAPVLATKRTFTAPPTQRLHSAFVTVRFDQDIEDMTYGMVNGEPNNFTFKEGLAYKVPLPVAEHLNGLGMVRQWISG